MAAKFTLLTISLYYLLSEGDRQEKKIDKERYTIQNAV